MSDVDTLRARYEAELALAGRWAGHCRLAGQCARNGPCDRNCQPPERVRWWLAKLRAAQSVESAVRCASASPIGTPVLDLREQSIERRAP